MTSGMGIGIVSCGLRREGTPTRKYIYPQRLRDERTEKSRRNGTGFLFGRLEPFIMWNTFCPSGVDLLHLPPKGEEGEGGRRIPRDGGKSLRLRRRRSPFILTFLMTGSLAPDHRKLYIIKRFRGLCRLVSARGRRGKLRAVQFLSAIFV